MRKRGEKGNHESIGHEWKGEGKLHQGVTNEIHRLISRSYNS